MTLARVAERSGLNVGYLSQIENDRASPSLAVLGQIAEALDVSPAWFLMNDVPPPRVVRAAERPVTATDGGRVEHVDGRTSRDVAILEVVGAPGSRVGAHAHPGDEHHIVLRGRMRLTQGEHSIEAGPGDYVRGTGRSRMTARSSATRRPRCCSSGSTRGREGFTRTIVSVTRQAVTYASYLKVPELLALQVERSAGTDGPEHDELLFIVIHQVYELWFKQVRHELLGVQRALESGDTDTALHLLNRVLKILKTLVAQVDVLETMTPLQFLSFRDRLESASGFQSGGFRQVEALLGIRDPAAAHAQPADSEARRAIEADQAGRSVWDSFLVYLGGRGHAVPPDIAVPDPRVQEIIVAVYRGDPDAALVAERLVDLDEGVQEWRYRHVKMVERTIGTKQGTGGSSGVEYLRATLFKPAFPDLWGIRSRL